MLYLIGLGLADETDITVKGLELVRKVDRVYLEAYTSILLVETSKLVRHSNLRLLLCTYLTLRLCKVGSLLWPPCYYRRPGYGRDCK